MQWKGFRSLRSPGLPQELLADLRDLDRLIKDFNTRLALFVEAEPVSTDSGGGAALNDEPFVTIGTTANLTAERSLTGTAANISVTDGGAGGAATLNLIDTAVTPGAYTYASVTVDQKGRLTAASSGSAPAAAANPTGTVGLATVNGAAATYMRSDAAPPLDQGIVPTWTGAHVFTPEATFNGGIDLGTSGVIDSNVVNGVGASSYKLKTSVDQTAGTDRYHTRFLKADGTTSLLDVCADGTVALNNVTPSGGFLSIGGALPATSFLGMAFQPNSFGTTGAIGGFLTAVGGAAFTAVNDADATNVIGGLFQITQSNVLTQTDLFAGYFRFSRATVNASSIATRIGCVYLEMVGGSTKGTVTDAYGIYAPTFSGLPTAANRTWIYLSKLTAGSGNTNEIMLADAGGIFFREQTALVRSDGTGHLDLYAATSIDMNGDVDMSTVDLITDGTTGTKIGTATTQKIAFYGSTPIVQPSAYTQTYSTAEKTNAALTSATLTDSTGGTPGTTLAAITGGGAGCENATKDAVASLAAQVNALRVDLEDVKQLANSVIDDLQSLGLAA